MLNLNSLYEVNRIYLEDNYLGYEILSNGEVRIDSINACNVDAFYHLLEGLISIAHENRSSRIFVADTLPDDLVQAFMERGFIQRNVLCDPNKYLYLFL